MIQPRRPGKKKTQLEVWARAGSAVVGSVAVIAFVAALVVSIIAWVFSFCFNSAVAVRFHVAPMSYLEALGWLGMLAFIVVAAALLIDRKGAK